MHRPNTFIVGAPKCGTTALAQYLAEHPQVFFSDPKEPFFWSADYKGLADQHALGTLDDYLALFQKAGEQHRVVAEGSTNTLRSDCAVERIVAFDPRARFVAMLRDPVDVAHAFHMEQVYVLNEDEPDFETAWRMQDRRAQGHAIPRACRAPQFLQYGAIGRYGEQVENLLRHVSRDAVLFIRFEDFRDDPARIYRQTLAFLGLDDDRRSEFPVVNASHRHRSRLVASMVLDPPALLKVPVWRLRTHLRRARYPLIEKIKSHLRQPSRRAALTPELRAEMRAYFHDDLLKLERLLGWDLRSWREGDEATDSLAPSARRFA
ncbi:MULTISPECIES: sulfotransferase family protein [Hydrocarboniphaga]|uniref:Sulfotransferase domain-containing protein n=1 Tax=Hydrocarboniphaga effusa AP103 TaxID=1172194 RepID=I8T639_9GAMM|nr:MULTISPECIES: sulfotransferase [Hydrocarboniphaga]EIT69415.1 hypothetical protein WQQ_29970 [Hydrocarboniphaga effusa AP103]MDZ4079208.1 sulfotransferase [Hydrocarboniphaga sp.]